jgi:hypothetical protein
MPLLTGRKFVSYGHEESVRSLSLLAARCMCAWYATAAPRDASLNRIGARSRSTSDPVCRIRLLGKVESFSGRGQSGRARSPSRHRSRSRQRDKASDVAVKKERRERSRS